LASFEKDQNMLSQLNSSNIYTLLLCCDGIFKTFCVTIEFKNNGTSSITKKEKKNFTQYSRQNSLWKRLWTLRNTEYAMNDKPGGMAIAPIS